LSHEYASPGEWSLGDMQAGEIVTLNYKAQIDSAQQPGLYNDLAWADGTDDRSARVLATSMPAPAVDPGEITDNFVGTQIELAVAPLPQRVELEEDEEIETKTKKKVLGVTTYLPATGTPTIWIILAAIALIAGGGMIMMARRRNNKMKNMTDKTLMLAVILTGMMFLGANAEAMAPAIRLAQPDTPTEIRNQNIAFTVLDVDNRSLTVNCYKKGPADLIWVNFSTINLPAGGSSGVCAINLDSDGAYQFYAKAIAGGEESDSKIVSLSLNTAIPGTPRKYNRNGGSCSVSFTTADDGGLTSKVVMYRSKNTEFVADNSTKVQEGNFGSNVEGVLTDPNDNCDDYYYAIQALSEGGIGSDFTGDEDVDVETRTRTRTVYEENIVYTGGGAIPVNQEGAEGTVNEEAASTATEGGVTEEGAVQGEATEGALSEGAESEQGKVAGMFSEKNSRYGWILIGLAVLGGVYYVMRRKAKKKSEIPLDEN
ncbi:MAG: LPXTG cell wall anchor domain-containing protein, partial [Candidatus Moraniibacteriota bacterium]